MSLYTHRAWWALSIVSIGSAFWSYSPFFQSELVPVFMAQLPGIFVSALLYASIGCVYAILARVAHRKLVFYLGGAHVIFQGVAIIAGSFIVYFRSQGMANGTQLDMSDMIGVAYLVSGASVFAALAFFAAMVAALSEMRKRINENVF